MCDGFIGFENSLEWQVRTLNIWEGAVVQIVFLDIEISGSLTIFLEVIDESCRYFDADRNPAK